MTNDKRKFEKQLATRSGLIKAALDEGIFKREDLSRVTGLKNHEISNTFTHNRELYGTYVLRKRGMIDIASDNVFDIIRDKTHPQNFAASKFILQKYNSEMDDMFESSDSEQLNMSVSSGSSSPITIKFTKD